MKLINLNSLVKSLSSLFKKKERITEFEPNQVYIAFKDSRTRKNYESWRSSYNYEVDIIINRKIYSTNMGIELSGRENEMEYYFCLNPKFNVYDIDTKEITLKDLDLYDGIYDIKINDLVEMNFQVLPTGKIGKSQKDEIADVIFKKMINLCGKKNQKNILFNEYYNLKLTKFFNTIHNSPMMVSIEKALLETQIIEPLESGRAKTIEKNKI